MVRTRLTWLVAGSLLFGSAFGCAKDLNISEPVDLSKVVVAQFDPTNPIPVLRLVPSPTQIVQETGTGNLVAASVAPQACELPTTKQCLQFAGAGGWPTSTPITLFFSGDVDPASIPGGIILIEALEGALPTPVPFEPVISARPPVTEACLQQFSLDAEQVPPGIQVVLRPTNPIKAGARYLLVVKSGSADGLRAADGSRVQPSSLFHLLNVADTGSDETRPVRLTPADPMNPLSQINDPLLRSNVQDLVVAQIGMGTPFSEFTTEQRAAWATAVSSSATRLFGLFQFFNGVIGPLQQANVVTERNDVVFANTWTTAPVVAPSPPWEFDPLAGKVPFPNAQLLTVTSTVRGGMKVENLPADNGNLDHIERTVNGFSTTSSVVMGVLAHVDPASIDPTPNTPCTADDCRIVMYRLNDQDMIADAAGVALSVDVFNGIDSKTMTNSATVTIAPVTPLLPNTEYVIGVKRGITTPEGALIGSGGQIFEFLKSPTPFVDATGNTAETIDLFGTPFNFKQALECQPVPLTGMLASPDAVKMQAGLLEVRLQHQRWLPAFSALEGLSTPVARTSLLMAFTYKTQDIHYDIDQIKANRLCSGSPDCWEEATIIDTGFEVRGAEAIGAAINVVGTLCVPVCELGGMAPAIPPDQCVTRDAMGNIIGINPALGTSSVCTLAKSLITSRLGAMHKYVLVGHKIARGTPMNPNPRVGSWNAEAIDNPVDTSIPFWVVTGTGTPSAGGYPVVMFQHGLGSVKEAGFYMANTLASNNRFGDPAGWAMVMMDLPFHGERASDLINNTTGQPCGNVDPNEINCSDPDGPGPQPVACAGVMGAPICDGRQDPSGTGFLGVNLFATRDNFRQSTVDQLTMLRALRQASEAGGALDHLDTSRVAYIGQSLGSITGANLAAYSTPEELTGMALNVGGGGLVNNILLQTVPQIAAPLYFALSQIGVCTLNVAGNPASGCQDTPGFRRFRIVAQWILDPGDPLATSVGVTREIEAGRTPFGADKLLMQMSLPDPVVSNEASIDLARSYFEQGEESGSFTTYDFSTLPNARVGSGCHSFLLAPVCGECLTDNICNSLGAQVEATAFVTTGTRLTEAQRQGAVGAATGFDCANPCAD
jgi:pimeloyl-ACP methyl ester carboxylesterase